MITIFKKGVVVIRLWRWNQFQIELCLFPPWTGHVPMHKHTEQDIELVHIWGKALYKKQIKTTFPGGTSFSLENKVHKTRWFADTFRAFTIRAGEEHGAYVWPTGLITLSCQTWREGFKPTSVTDDYVE